jgi:hypothetical protein
MSLSLRFRIERTLAIATSVMCAITAVWPDWIETVSGFDPDHGSGWAEWVACGVLAVAAISFGLLARADHRRLTVAPAG